jgi:hypothetical protein
MKVFIHAIPRDNAQGLHEFESDSTGQKLKKNKIGAYPKDRFRMAIDSKTGLCKSGLSKPWIENGAQKKDKDGNLLTLQDYYEQKFQLEKGYLHSKPTERDIATPLLKDKSFSPVEEIFIELNDGTTVLDLDILEDCLEYEFALEHPFIANSEKEYRQHKWPKAMYYIAVENESDEIKYQKTAAISTATSYLHDDILTLPYKRQMIVILKISSARSVLTEAQVHNLLYEYVQNSTHGPGSNLEKFKELYLMIKDAKGRPEFDARYTLQKSQDYYVINEKQGTYSWVRPTGVIVIGETYGEAIQFITNPKKVAVIEELKHELSAKE